MSKRKTNEEFQRELEVCRQHGQDVYCDDDYIDAKTKLNFYCSNGHHWLVRPTNIFSQKNGCPYCAHKAVLADFNSVATLRPDLIKYFKNADDAYCLTPSSHKQPNLICPDCGAQRTMAMYTLSTYGFSCQNCGHTISYPNRLIRAVMNQFESQLDILQYEWSQKWTNRQRYDVYFEISGNKYVIEMQGQQHYEIIWDHGLSVEEVRKYDIDKMENAKLHNIIPIVIDARISDFDFIFKNIKSSLLFKILDFSIIDMQQCRVESTKNIIQRACELYDIEHMTIRELAKLFKVHKDTIRNYLKQGAELGWSLYDPKIASEKNNINRGVAVNVYNLSNDLVGQYSSVALASREMTKRYNIKFAITSIFRCIESGKLYKDFYFKTTN